MDTEWLEPALIPHAQEGFARLDAGLDVPISLLRRIDEVLIRTWPPPEGCDSWDDVSSSEDTDESNDAESDEPSLTAAPHHFPWTNILVQFGLEGAMRFLDSGRNVPLIHQLMLDAAIDSTPLHDRERDDFVPDEWI